LRSVVAGLGITLDGVVESPGSWMRMDAEMSELISAGIARADAILLGPRTYLDMARIWPTQGSDVPMADFMNNTSKYVLSSTLGSADWGDTRVLRGSLIDEVTALKNRPAATSRCRAVRAWSARCCRPAARRAQPDDQPGRTRFRAATLRRPGRADRPRPERLDGATFRRDRGHLPGRRLRHPADQQYAAPVLNTWRR
jgi:hypothetical protein